MLSHFSTSATFFTTLLETILPAPAEATIAFSGLGILLIISLVLLQSRTLWSQDDITRKSLRGILMGCVICQASMLSMLIQLQLGIEIRDQYLATLAAGGLSGVVAIFSAFTLDATKRRYSMMLTIATIIVIAIPIDIAITFPLTRQIIILG